jgi:glycosyltransferase involved in cell wall biosynthesis
VKIGVDARFLVEQQTGVETYFHQLLSRLIRLGGEDEYVLFRADSLMPELPPGRWRLVGASGRAWSWGLTGKLSGEALDLFYSPVTAFPLAGAPRSIVTIHDLSWHHTPSSYSALERARQRRWTALAASHADGIVVVSESTAKDLAALHPSAAGKMITISPGVDDTCFGSVPAPEVQRVRDRYGLQGRYLLALASFHPRKNLPGLVEAYDRFRERGPERIQLLLAGRGGSDSARLLSRIARSPYRRDILLSGYVPREDLAALYASAELFALVSHYEGFGIPALEAMARGTPVLVSDLPVFQEVCGEAAIRVAPGDPDAVAEGIGASIRDTPERTRRIEEGIRRAHGYRWDDSATRLKDFFRHVESCAS